jgi:hypothetical protein
VKVVVRQQVRSSDKEHMQREKETAFLTLADNLLLKTCALNEWDYMTLFPRRLNNHPTIESCISKQDEKTICKLLSRTLRTSTSEHGPKKEKVHRRDDDQESSYHTHQFIRRRQVAVDNEPSDI